MGQYDRKAQSQPKHGKPSSSGASKAAAPIPVHRPEWRGPSYVKKPASRSQPTPPSDTPSLLQDQFVLVDVQQRLLNAFRSALPACDDFDALKPLLHQIHQACTLRDWDGAFEDEARREAYSLRWPPSRSLLYSNVLADISIQHPELDWFKAVQDESNRAAATAICFGGGPAAMMGLAGFLRAVNSAAHGRPCQVESIQPQTLPGIPTINLTLVDAVDWSSVTAKLQNALITAPALSKYASAAARSANAAFLSPQALKVSCHQKTVLDIDNVSALIGSGPAAILFFHTLADLMTSSLSRTTALLRAIESAIPPGGLIIMIDSADATVPVGSSDDDETRACPLDWVLGRLLLPVEQNGADQQQHGTEAKWERIVHERVRTHRLDKKLAYPAGLENLKCQYHVYQRR